MKRLVAALAVLGSVLPLASPAFAVCTCRAKNVVAPEGQTVCIATPSGRRMARCDKVINMMSWTFVSGACPIVSARR